jgi:hypothetical protein
MATEEQIQQAATAAAAAAAALTAKAGQESADTQAAKESDGQDKTTAETYEGNLAASAQRIRDTAKWLIAAFAAVGAILIAGLQLKDLGQLDGIDAVLAAVGAVLGIAGVVVVLFCASAILAAGRVPMTDLTGTSARRPDITERLERSPNLFQPFDSIEQFNQELSERWRTQAQAFLEYNDETKPDEARRAARDRYMVAGRFLRQFNPLNRRLLATAEYENVRSRWDGNRAWIVVGVVVAAIGAGLFAYTSQPGEDPATEEPAVPATPARGFLHLTEAGQDEFAEILGQDCPTRNLPVLALGRSEDGYDLVTDPDDESVCSVKRIEVSDSEGELTGPELPPFEQPD